MALLVLQHVGFLFKCVIEKYDYLDNFLYEQWVELINYKMLYHTELPFILLRSAIFYYDNGQHFLRRICDFTVVTAC